MRSQAHTRPITWPPLRWIAQIQKSLSPPHETRLDWVASRLDLSISNITSIQRIWHNDRVNISKRTNNSFSRYKHHLEQSIAFQTCTVIIEFDEAILAKLWSPCKWVAGFRWTAPVMHWSEKWLWHVSQPERYIVVNGQRFGRCFG